MTTRHMAAILLAIILSSCGGSGSHGDCRDDDLSCFEPFVCRASDAIPGTYACLSPVGDMPSCTGTPTGQEVPFALVPGTDIPLHWTTTGGMVDVTYSFDFTPDVVDPRVVSMSWDSHSCAFDLLEAPNRELDPPSIERAERRIHFQMTELEGASAQTTVYYEQATGRIMTAIIDIDPDHAATIEKGQMLYLLGLALGMDNAPAGTDSVMAPDSTLDSESSLDVDAFCALYGETGSYCGD